MVLFQRVICLRAILMMANTAILLIKLRWKSEYFPEHTAERLQLVSDRSISTLWRLRRLDMHNPALHNNSSILHSLVRSKWPRIMTAYYETDLRSLVPVLTERIEGTGDENVDSWVKCAWVFEEYLQRFVHDFLAENSMSILITTEKVEGAFLRLCNLFEGQLTFLTFKKFKHLSAIHSHFGVLTFFLIIVWICNSKPMTFDRGGN